MRMMVAALLSAMSFFELASPSFAASPNDFTGVYVGVGGGYAWGNRTWKYGPPFFTEPNPNPQNLSGAIIGAHAGGQVQMGSVVLGIEGQALATGLTKSAVCPSPAYSCTFKMVGPVLTAAPRVGLAMGDMMAYGTAGYAGANMTTTATFVSNGALLEEGQAWHNGWIAGGGVDWQASPSWVFGLQYLHLDLGTALHVIVADPAENHNVSAVFDLVTARVSYRFH